MEWTTRQHEEIELNLVKSARTQTPSSSIVGLNTRLCNPGKVSRNWRVVLCLCSIHRLILSSVLASKRRHA